MRRYAQYDSSGQLIGIGLGVGGVEISTEEYERFYATTREKAGYVAAVQAGKMDIADVPQAYRAEVAEIVQRRNAESEDEEATEADYLDALAAFGVKV